MRNRLSLIFSAFLMFISQGRAIAEDIITNPARSDGFGAQFQSIIYSVIYAELNGMRFVYTPFKTMEHNYDGDPHFLERKEQLINFIGNFEMNEGLVVQPPIHHLYYTFFEANLSLCAKSQALKKIKTVFRLNKNKSDYFDGKHFHIAVHIRRPNSHDSRLAGADTPDGVYLRIIKFLRKKFRFHNPLFHIYSQGEDHDFQTRYCAADTVFHINESIEQTFASLVLADALVTSASSFSYVAAILSDGLVYYMPFWHPPLPGWRAI